MKTRFDINGVCVDAVFDDGSVERVLKPLVGKILHCAKETDGRMVVLLAAPPAAGKSTLAAFLEQLSGGRIQALGMDGFHYHQADILKKTVERGGERIPMVRVKGAPESFDVEKLRRTLEAVKRGEDVYFPVYDRRLHDVVEDAVRVSGEVLLIEGNWLMLDEEAWRGLPCDFSIFVSGREALLRSRVIDRRLRTGRTKEEAEMLYAECDGPNIRLCMERHIKADVHLDMLCDGYYVRM